MASGKSVMALIKALKPTFRSGNDNDKVAFAVHAYFLASGYELTATGLNAFNPSALTSSSTDEVGIEEWNELDDQYAFVYVNPEKGSTKVRVKCLVMEGKLQVYYALVDGSSKHVELNVGDYVEENGCCNYRRQFKNMEMLVTSLDSVHSLSPEASETRYVRRIKIEPGSGHRPEAHLSCRKRKELHTHFEESEIQVNTTKAASLGSVKVDTPEEEKPVCMQYVYTTRRVRQKKGSGSDEAVGLGILIEDKRIDDKELHDVLIAAPNLLSVLNPKVQPISASKSGSDPATCHVLSDSIPPRPFKKINPCHLQDEEMHRGAEPHGDLVAAPNLLSPLVPKGQPTPASKAGCSAPTSLHPLSDQILSTPLKNMNPRHLQDGEVYRGRR